MVGSIYYTECEVFMNILEKRTKIIATLGPASENPETVLALLKAGVNVFRLNFSHKNFEEADAAIAMVRKARQELGVPVAIMADIKGPAIRLYGYASALPIKEGSRLVIRSVIQEKLPAMPPAPEGEVYTNLPEIDLLCVVGQRVVLMDGYFTASVVSILPGAVEIEIGNPGTLRPKAHLTIPNVDYPIPFLSEKDIADIGFAVDRELEYIALSFVRCATDLEEVRRLIGRCHTQSGRRPSPRLIAKIESAIGLSNVDEIVESADGIMVARGDMGVEIAIESVPIAQKKIIRKGYLGAKPVITATQMLESMIENPLPTRAEASDVANACFDSTSAVMLSGETAMGRYPVQVVKTMNSIIRAVESEFDYRGFHADVPASVRSSDLPAIVSYAAVSVAYECNAAAIIVLTETGHAARLISRLRPRMPIFAFLKDEMVYNQLAMNWGVHPFILTGAGERLDTVVAECMEICARAGLVSKGDKVVIVAGLPLARQGTTNMLRVETAS